ncbi:MAG: Fic family protein [Spirochaetaceae bacterium]
MSEPLHIPLELVTPDFDDHLTDLIIELDHQRKSTPSGTTPTYIFDQIKNIFHIMESLGSARIEGNRTTVAEYIDYKMEGKSPDTTLQEIRNIESALIFLEKHTSAGGMQLRIDERLVRELHEMVTHDLPVEGEGDASPGEYRRGEVSIAHSTHRPPQAADVPALMEELLQFIQHEDPPKYDLIKISLAHHRFAWIHPFSNGNGRTVRLLTFALLLNAGFRVGGEHPSSRILNPTAVFCSDRNRYYDQLSDADTGTREGLLSWCRYVLEGIKTELDKIERLLDYTYLRSKIIQPAIIDLHKKNGISDHERGVLLTAAEKGPIQNRDIRPVTGGLSQVQASRILQGLRERGLLQHSPESKRSYVIGFVHTSLMRELLHKLDELGFLPLKGEV